MNRRSFLASLAAVFCAPFAKAKAKALNLSVQKRAGFIVSVYLTDEQVWRSREYAVHLLSDELKYATGVAPSDPKIFNR